MNFFDKALAVLSPRRAFTRAKFRAAADAVRRYDAASKSRRTASWRAGSGSQNAEADRDLPMLRDRSRDLVRNNPYAKRAVEIITTNVVGAGIQPTPLKLKKAAATRVKDAWKKWADSSAADTNRQLNFYAMERLALRCMVESGEVLIRRVRRNNGPGVVPLSLQILEPDFLDTGITRNTDGGGYIIQGVEFNAAGERVAYWLFSEHPGDIIAHRTLGSRPVPAADIIHLYKLDRPGQVRGIPFGVSAFIRLRDLDAYADAQLVRQQIAACFTAFVTDTSEGSAAANTPYSGLSRVEPGIIEELPPGKSITFGTPPKADQYEEYVRAVLREIACAYGVSYEALTGDLSNVNFSSARMGFIEFSRLIEEIQELTLVPMFLAPVWEWFADAARVARVLPTKEIAVQWTSPRRLMVDPAKETKAKSDAVRNGFISWGETVRADGYDPEQVLDEIEAEQKEFDRRGLMLASDARNDNNRGDQFAVPNEQAEEKPAGATTPAGKKAAKVANKNLEE